MKEELVLTNPRLRVFFIAMLVIGLLFCSLLVLRIDPVSHEETVEISEDDYFILDTELGVATGMRYHVEVIQGGHVDVYIAGDADHPVNEAIEGHPDVGNIEGIVPEAHRFFHIIIDNTDLIGGPSHGPVEVQVEYKSTSSFWLLRLGICVPIGVIVPLVFLVQPILYKRKHPMRRTIYKPVGRALNAWDVDTWMRENRPVMIALIVGIQFPHDDHRYYVISEGEAYDILVQSNERGAVLRR